MLPLQAILEPTPLMAESPTYWRPREAPIPPAGALIPGVASGPASLSQGRIHCRLPGLGLRTRWPSPIWGNLLEAANQLFGLRGSSEHFRSFRIERHYDELAVDVPAISSPQIGCDDTGTKPFFFACMTQEH
jgi:hypothetical protein